MRIKEAPITKVTDKAFADLIVDSIHDVKGKNIVMLDLRNLDYAPTDYFIICEGASNTQVRAIAQNITRRVKEERGMMANHVEGISDSKWILVDYFDMIVHIFYTETRSFYDLDNLWNDGEKTEYENI